MFPTFEPTNNIKFKSDNTVSCRESSRVMRIVLWFLTYNPKIKWLSYIQLTSIPLTAAVSLDFYLVIAFCVNNLCSFVYLIYIKVKMYKVWELELVAIAEEYWLMTHLRYKLSCPPSNWTVKGRCQFRKPGQTTETDCECIRSF